MNGQYQLVVNELYLGSKVMLNKDNANIICNNNRQKEFFEKYVINCFNLVYIKLVYYLFVFILFDFTTDVDSFYKLPH